MSDSCVFVSHSENAFQKKRNEKQKQKSMCDKKSKSTCHAAIITNCTERNTYYPVSLCNT